MSRRAKIAATLGPACDDAEVLSRMVEAGLDVARINFSHGESADHRRRSRLLRRVSRRAGRSVALLVDLQGPRFRVGRLPGGSVQLSAGDRVDLVAGRSRAEAGRIPVAYAALARDVRPRDPILLDDGKLALRVKRVQGSVVRCEVERGGVLQDRKGINLPGGTLSASALTPKDRRDLSVAVEIGADWLAVSFVRQASDVRAAKRLLAKRGSSIPVLAKIERPEAIDGLDAILDEADGLMVARGDLGVELPPERVPTLQKEIIEKANRVGKPVMTATQMLDSMRLQPRPTRAEASDVANAVLDGSGCLLLTAETAAGRYPVESVAMMARIIEEAERSGRTRRPPDPSGTLSIAAAACLAASRAAADVDARYVVAFTESGSTARKLARFRPETPILAFTPSEETRRQLAPVWGVQTQFLGALRSTDLVMKALDRALVDGGLARKGDRVVVLLGLPLRVAGTTNLMKIHEVGDGVGVAVSGTPAKRARTGKTTAARASGTSRGRRRVRT